MINSCLYKATVMHHRLSPKEHRFHYDIFMFYLDLDEIDQAFAGLEVEGARYPEHMMKLVGR